MDFKVFITMTEASRSECGEEHVQLVVVFPLQVGSLLTQGQGAVDPFANAAGEALDDGQVGHHADEEEDRTHGEIGAHRKNIPHEGRFEVYPYHALGGIWKQPEEVPAASQVNEWE